MATNVLFNSGAAGSVQTTMEFFSSITEPTAGIRYLWSANKNRNSQEEAFCNMPDLSRAVYLLFLIE